MILILLLNFLYASAFILTKFGLAISQPMFLIGTRMIAGGIISLAMYALWTPSWKSDMYAITCKQWMLIGLIALINVYSCNALEVWGLQYLSVGKTAFIYNLTPFISAFFAYFIFAEQMTRQKWLGLTLGFLGFIPILIEPSNIIDTTASFGYLSLAELALIGAAISSVLGWTFIRILVKQKQFSPFLLNGLSLASGGFLCLGHAFCCEPQPFVQPDYLYLFIQITALVALFKYGIAYNLNAYLLTTHTTTLMAFFSFTASLFATVLGILFCNETVSAYFIVSVVCVFAGLCIFYQEELRQGYIK